MVVSRRTFQISSIVFLLLGLGWIYFSRIPSTKTAVNPSTAAQKGFLAPDFSAQTLGGEIIHLSDLRGRPVILNLWASWCPPCREEMPVLQKIFTENQEKGLAVLGLNLTSQDSRENADAFVQKNNLTFPVLLDPDGDISRLFRIQALPTTYFIGKDGVIRDLIIGGPVPEAVLRAQVYELLQGTP
jgi:cytochrome c biogenesis protein CcmG/thiol:disulfide interchange protein DsbE